ncbi:MAG: hypothetical protein WC196_06180 [Bacilli bacterium]
MDNVTGQTIVKVRPMTQKEIDKEGWYRGTTVLELSNGVLLYASSDEEGNDAGAMFGTDKNKSFMLG